MSLITFHNTLEARCTSRPSKVCKSPYVADIELNGITYQAHSPALGMGGYIVPDAIVMVTKMENKSKKGVCEYSILAVKRNDVWVGANPIYANRVFQTAYKQNLLCDFYNYESDKIVAEYTHGNSRFDFFINNNYFVEVKSVLINDEIETQTAIFPVGNKKNGTISERANKHLTELTELVQDTKYKCAAVFIVLRDDVETFSPNKKKDPLFASLVEKAYNNGVNILAYQFKVHMNGIDFVKKLDVVFQ